MSKHHFFSYQEHYLSHIYIVERHESFSKIGRRSTAEYILCRKPCLRLVQMYQEKVLNSNKAGIHALFFFFIYEEDFMKKPSDSKNVFFIFCINSIPAFIQVLPSGTNTYIKKKEA